MAITVLTVSDCPHVELARERISAALAALGRHDEIHERIVTSAEEATNLGFGGSPTILVDGVDAFPVAGSPGMACRLYPTEDGLEGAPSVEQLVATFSS